MKQYSKKLFSLVVLCSTATVMLHADNGRVSPFLQWRSEGRDTARKLIGETTYAIYQGDMDGWYGSFAATVQYDQTFRGKEIAECLFGDSLVNTPAGTTTNNCDNDCGDKTIIISGLLDAAGAVRTNRAATEWMAENFYLPRNFSSALTFSPKVTNVLVDFNLYVGLDRWVNGLYFRLYGPVVHNKSGLHVKENNIVVSDVGYEEGYFDANTSIPAANLFQSALSFFGGCATPTYPDQSVILQPLKFAKLSGCNLPSVPATNNCNKDCDDICGSSNKKTGFAELRGEFGWNYIQDRYRFLINLQAAAPTGTRPNAEFALEAQVGNGKHWELGIGLGGAWKMWENEDRDKSFSFIVEADITHLFNARQTRTFDLIGKPNSRYMLAQKMAPNAGLADAVKLDGDSDNGVQFANEYAPVANLTTQNVKVSIGAQGDVVAMFNYSVRGFSWDIGYNFWGMSTSDIKCPDNCSDDCATACGVVPFLANTWALKGDASVGGFYEDGGDTIRVRLAATESKATIFNGTNAGPNNTLANIDGPGVVATANGENVLSFIAPNAPIGTSNPPIFIKSSDFDIEGAETRGLSHKVFTHFSYTWTRNERWLPYLGAGFSAQFGSHSGSHDDCPTATTTNSCDDSSVSCALSNWAVFVKGGISFH